MNIYDIASQFSEQAPPCPIWNVEPIEYPVRLWRINPTNYQITEDGALADILANPLYFLISKKLLDLFQSISSINLHPEPVQIFDPTSKTFTNNYFTISAETFSIESAFPEDKNEMRIWVNRSLGALFVSRLLKETIEATGYNSITFAPGYSGFAGV